MAVPNDLRQINRRRLVQAALRMGTASRSELARATGLSLPTAGKIVDELCAERILTSAPSSSSNRDSTGAARLGRPGHYLEFHSTATQYVAIQLGMRNTRLALLASAPPTDDSWDATFPTHTNADKWARSVVSAVTNLHKSPKAVVISAPGVVDETTGTIYVSPNLHWLDGLNLPALLHTAGLRATVHVVQEISVLALGELATNRTSLDFLLVDFGHGVAATTVIGGKVHRGNVPMIGEIGHTTVPGNDRPCGCGGVGCLETLLSRSAIARAVLGEAPASDTDARAMWGQVIAVTRANPMPLSLARAIDAAGAGIAAAMNALGVDRVVITGSLPELGNAILDPLSLAIRRYSFWARLATIEIESRPRHRLAGLGFVILDRVIAPPVNSSPAQRFAATIS